MVCVDVSGGRGGEGRRCEVAEEVGRREMDERERKRGRVTEAIE